MTIDSSSLFNDPPITATRVYAGEVRITDDLIFWNKITGVIKAQIHADDGNLHFDVNGDEKLQIKSDGEFLMDGYIKSVNASFSIATDELVFRDSALNQLGYIDSTGVIHGLTLNLPSQLPIIDINSGTSGTLNNSRLGSTLEADIITPKTGTKIQLGSSALYSPYIDDTNYELRCGVVRARITNLNFYADNYNVFPLAGGASKFSVNSLGVVNAPNGSGIQNLNASFLSSGTINNARLPSTISVDTLVGNGSGITDLNATSITSGTLNNSRLPDTISQTNIFGNSGIFNYVGTNTIQYAEILGGIPTIPVGTKRLEYLADVHSFGGWTGTPTYATIDSTNLTLYNGLRLNGASYDIEWNATSPASIESLDRWKIGGILSYPPSGSTAIPLVGKPAVGQTQIMSLFTSGGAEVLYATDTFVKSFVDFHVEDINFNRRDNWAWTSYDVGIIQGADTFTWRTRDNNTDVMFLDTSSRYLGVNFNSPVYALDMRGQLNVRQSDSTHGFRTFANASYADLYLVGTTNSVVGNPYFRWYPSSASTNARVVLWGWNSATQVDADFCLGDGNLGVGTETPRQRLDVVGNMLINWSGSYIIADGTAYTADTVPFSVISNPTSGVLTLGLQNSTTTGTPASLGFFREDNVGNSKLVAGIYSIDGVDTANAYDGGLDLRIALNGNSGGYDPLYTAMRINSYGNVGIGTTTPEAKLHIETSALSATGGQSVSGLSIKMPSINNDRILFYSYRNTTGFDWTSAIPTIARVVDSTYHNFIRFDNDLTRIGDFRYGERMTINNNNGNVGIGTANPTRKLHLYSYQAGSANQGFKVEATNTTNTDYLTAEWSPGYITNHVRWTIRNKAQYHTWESAGGTERMRVNWTGNVGIGKTTPLAKLEVASGSYDTTYASARYFRHDINYNNGPSEFFGQVSIFADDDIISKQFIASHAGTMSASDERIKENIEDISDTEALDKLRLLKPKTYTYMDTIGRGTEKVMGFIAQEVEQVLPLATGKRYDAIPNIYELANVSASNVITFTNFNTSNLTANTMIDAKTETSGDMRLTIEEVIDEHSIKIKEDVDGEQVFVMGEYVDDFTFLKKDHIWTIATAALQEVDRQQQADKERIATLEAQVNNLIQIVNELREANTSTST